MEEGALSPELEQVNEGKSGAAVQGRSPGASCRPTNRSYGPLCSRGRMTFQLEREQREREAQHGQAAVAVPGCLHGSAIGSEPPHHQLKDYWRHNVAPPRQGKGPAEGEYSAALRKDKADDLTST